MSELRASYTGSPGAYVGLIKRGDVVVWRCPHLHRNRDQQTKHTAARPCAQRVLDALMDSEKARAVLEAARHGVPHFQHAWQAQEYRLILERWEWARGQAEILRGQLAALGEAP